MNACRVDHDEKKEEEEVTIFPTITIVALMRMILIRSFDLYF